jgi:hypothetical protein
MGGSSGTGAIGELGWAKPLCAQNKAARIETNVKLLNRLRFQGRLLPNLVVIVAWPKRSTG